MEHAGLLATKAGTIARALGDRREPSTGQPLVGFTVHEYACTHSGVRIHYRFGADASGAHNGATTVTYRGGVVLEQHLDTPPKAYQPGPWEEAIHILYLAAKRAEFIAQDTSGR